MGYVSVFDNDEIIKIDLLSNEKSVFKIEKNEKNLVDDLRK